MPFHGEICMDEIRTFVDKVYDRAKSRNDLLEEDQILPPKEVFEKVCHILLNVSTMREELRYPSFRVCFANPDSRLLDVYIHSHTVFFEKPIPFHAKELHKLAPALSSAMSYLMLDTSGDDFRIIGINASYTAWESILSMEAATGNRMPKIPNLYLRGPGEFDACFGESTLVRYKSGVSMYFRTDTFSSTAVADELRRGSNVSDEDRQRVLCGLIRKAVSYQHGGQLYIVPSEEACAQHLVIKYRMPVRFAFGKADKVHGRPEVVSKKALITYTDLLAKFTAVDGAVIVNKNLDLIGFGSEVIAANDNMNLPQMCFLTHDNKVDTTKHYTDNGMRHRAGYRFCDTVEGAVAIVISQDGTVKACTRKDGKVMVYDNVGIPLF